MYASENLLKSEYDDNIRQHFIILALQVITCIVGIIFILLIAFNPLRAHAAEANGKYVYNFNAYTNGYKYDLVLSSDYPCVAQIEYDNIVRNGNVVGGNLYDNYKINFYTLDSSGKAVLINPYVVRTYKRVNNVWTSSDDLSYEYGERQYASSASGRSNFFDFGGSSLKCLFYTTLDFEYDSETGEYNHFRVGKDNVSFYLKYGLLKEIPHDTNAYALSNTFNIPLSRYWYTASDNYKFYLDDTSDFSLSNVSITEDGVITWDTPIVPNGCKFAGVSVYYGSSNYLFYKNFRLDHSIKVNLNGNEAIQSLRLFPYYITSDGDIVYPSKVSSISLDANASYFNREGELFTQYAINDAVEGVRPGTDIDYIGDVSHNGGLTDNISNSKFDSSLPALSGLERINNGFSNPLSSYSQSVTFNWDDRYNSDLYYIQVRTTFRYKMNRDKEWQEVTVDTSLPTKRFSTLVDSGTFTYTYGDYANLFWQQDNNPFTQDDLDKAGNIQPVKDSIRIVKIDGNKVTTGYWTTFSLKNGIWETGVVGNIDVSEEIKEDNTGGNISDSIDDDSSVALGFDFSDITGIWNKFLSVVNSLFSFVGSFPALFAVVFGFLPLEIRNMIFTSLVALCVIAVIKAVIS